MNRSPLAAAFAVAVTGLAGVATAANAADAHKSTVKYEKCYGISAAGKNDCSAGAHSCAGQSTVTRDKASFVDLPAGACGKIAGGSLKPA